MAGLPPGTLLKICQAFRFTPTTFPFVHVDKGLFQLKDGKTLQFLHARVTTGDRGEDMVTGARGSAGDLWRAATDHSVKDYQCAAWNCNNKNYQHGQRHKAEVAAHVYSVTQGLHDPIEYMMLIPTCNACNNRWGTERDETCFPGKPGDNKTILQTYPNSKESVIFIKINKKTEGGKGNAGLGPGGGKGSGKGQGGATGGGPGIGTKGAGRGSPKPAAGMIGRGRGVAGGGAKAPGKASPKPAAGMSSKASVKMIGRGRGGVTGGGAKASPKPAAGKLKKAKQINQPKSKK